MWLAATHQKHLRTRSSQLFITLSINNFFLKPSLTTPSTDGKALSWKKKNNSSQERRVGNLLPEYFLILAKDKVLTLSQSSPAFKNR